MISTKPPFSSPTMFSAGTRTSSKLSSPVSEHSQPIFFSGGATVKPGVSLSMTIRLMPAYPSPPVRTAVVTKSARTPDVMNVLAPLTT